MSLPLDRMTLQGRKLTSVFGNSLQSSDMDLTIEVAGQINLTINDPERLMFAADGLLDQNGDGLLDADLRLLVPGASGVIAYRLAKVTKQGDLFTLPFEDEASALLRRHKRYIKATRKTSPDDKGGVTRAQFIHRMVREVKSPPLVFVCPEKGRFQDITVSTESSGRDVTARGLSSSAGLTVKGHAASSLQLKNGAELLRAATDVKATRKPSIALIAAAIVEDELKNQQGQGADSISFGTIQNIPGRSVGIDGVMTKAQALDVYYSGKSALLPPGPTSKGGLIKLCKDHPDWDIGRVAAVAINGGGDPDYAAKVNARHDEAEKWVDAYGHTSGEGFTEQRASSASTSDYEFTRGEPGKPESSWTAAQRLAGEVGWRFFAVENVVTYASETRLFQSKSQVTLAEYQPGVDAIDWEWAPRKEINTLTATVRMEHGALLPGMVVTVAEQGPASGRWLITRVQQAGDSEHAALTLAQPQKPHKEPAAPTSSTATSSPTSSVSAAGDDSLVGKIYARGKTISDRNYPYVWGGGHPKVGEPSGGGYDCSGYVCDALHAAGLINTTLVSGDLAASWGKPGQGDAFTVYANKEHVFLQGTYKGKKFRLDTSPQGSLGESKRGPQLRTAWRTDTGRFTARHWQGA